MSESQVPTRETAHRVFASEFNDSHYTFKESDDERAPVYQLLRSGEKVNRVFFIGTLTEKNDVGTDKEYWQGRIVDPTGTFFVYAGQYQPEAAATMRSIEAPAYLAVVGKPRTYEQDDGNITVSIRPESINVVDAETRNRWVADAAEQTLDRIEGFDDLDNKYVEKAKEVYDDDLVSYKEAVIEALTTIDGVDAESVPVESDAESTESASESSDDPIGDFEDEADADPEEGVDTDEANTESATDEGDDPAGQTDGGQATIAESGSNA